MILDTTISAMPTSALSTPAFFLRSLQGGIFINAEQVSGSSRRLQNFFQSVHLDLARALGSSDAEIAGAIQRISYDECATADDQIQCLEKLGFEDADCFYRSFRFAVFGGWRPCPSADV